MLPSVDKGQHGFSGHLGHLAAGATSVLNGLLALASPELAETEEEAQRFCQAYWTTADALGYPGSQTDMMFAAHELQRGRTDEALDHLLKAAHDLAEQEVPRLLWRASIPETQYGEYRRSLGRMLRGALLSDPAFDGVRQDARYLETLKILDPEA